MIDFTEITYDSDLWELFTRDFLEEVGFHIETPPDRGADQGKDMLVTEDIAGRVYRGRFRWLVSCKHFAKSRKSVNETDDEPNILERLASFKAEGFIGFYSTLASAGLNTRLRQLRDEGKIRAYRIFDHKWIENHLVTVGFSKLMIRYLPESYKKVKPLHLITNQYEPLLCRTCGKDVLVEMFTKEYLANMVQIYMWDSTTRKEHIEDVYVACKGGCDREIDRDAKTRGLLTGWTDISDMVIPIEFLRFMFATMNRLRNGYDVYTDEAWKKKRAILITLAQKVLRYTTEKERERFKSLRAFPF
jgi:hypothetical protein